MARKLALITAAVITLAGAGAAAGQIGGAGPRVVTYPSSQTIRPTGSLPGGAGRVVSLNEPIGGDDAGLIVVSGARQIRVTVDDTKLAPLRATLRFWHFVGAGSGLVPDALLSWDGSTRPTEQPNQPLSVQVSVP